MRTLLTLDYELLFDPTAIVDIVRRYAAVLELARPDAACAYRAGGWMIRPFEKLRDALRDALQRLEAFLAGGSAGQVSTFAPYRQQKEAARPEALSA